MTKEQGTARFRATPEELQMIFDRSMSLRLAERNRSTAPPAAADAAKDAEKVARTKWRDATDRILKKPP